MGVFDTASKKVHNLLGMTTLGQKAKATALGVTLASDEDIVKAEDAVHSSGDKGIMALGVRKDTAAGLGADGDYVPLIVDSNGLLHVNIGSLIGLTTKGQQVMAASLPVVLPSDQDVEVADGGNALSVDDDGGSLTVDSDQLPAALGQTTKAGSMPVVLPSDQVVRVESQAHYYYGGVRGENAPMSRGFYEGDTSKWLARSGADDSVAPTDTLDSAGNVEKYFSAAGGSVGTDPIWVYIPLGVSTDGYKNFYIQIRNDLGKSVTATLYGVATAGLSDLDSSPIGRIKSELGYFQIATGTIADNASVGWGPNGTTLNGAQDMPPAGYLCLKVQPAEDPTDDGWSIVFMAW